MNALATNSHQTDVLVIGSGLAGLALALKLADQLKVTVLSKTSLGGGNSPMAQGGVAAVVSKNDTVQSHILDTLNAGAGLCRPEIVEFVVSQGAERIQDLVQWGIQFDLKDHEFDLTREGGHSERRVLHIEDHTGNIIHAHLLNKAKQHPQIELLENQFAIDLILEKNLNPQYFGQDRCWGAYVLNKTTGEAYPFLASHTVLATGGAGKVYRYTSNWGGATGDGVALAHRAGARVANLEFMQFHPTCLYHPHARNFLISEAVRGEGGELINDSGQAFMKSYSAQGSLAPRDIVARSIDAEMKKSGSDCVYLDITHKGAEYIRSRFPQIYNRCLELGIDITQAPIPVVPAAHYLCGGVWTDRHGHTDVEQLYAIGETACTGLHGANRLASNSLLECLVFAHSASQNILEVHKDIRRPQLPVPAWREGSFQDPDELIVVSHMWEEVRNLMWNYVGIVRSNRRLERARHRLKLIREELEDYYSHFKTLSDIEELRNICLVAELTVICAQSRKESRGIHYSIDYPFVEDPMESPGHDSLISSYF